MFTQRTCTKYVNASVKLLLFNVIIVCISMFTCCGKVLATASSHPAYECYISAKSSAHAMVVVTSHILTTCNI